MKEKPEIEITAKDPDGTGANKAKSGIKSVVVVETPNGGKAERTELYKNNLKTDVQDTQAGNAVLYEYKDSYTVKNDGVVSIAVEVTDLSGNVTKTFVTADGSTDAKDELLFQVDTIDPEFTVTTSGPTEAFGKWKNQDYMLNINKTGSSVSNEVDYYYQLADSNTVEKAKFDDKNWTKINGTSFKTSKLYAEDENFLHKTLIVKAVSGSGRETIQWQDANDAETYEIKIQKAVKLYQKSNSIETGWRTWEAPKSQEDQTQQKIYSVTESMEKDNAITWSNTAKTVEVTAPYEYVTGGYTGYTPNITTHIQIADVQNKLTLNQETVLYDVKVTRKSTGEDAGKGMTDTAKVDGVEDESATYDTATGKITFPLTQDGKYEIRVYVSDEAGNTTESGSAKCIDTAKYFVDTTAPTNYKVKVNDSILYRAWASTIGKWFFSNKTTKMDISYNADISKIQSVQYLAVPLDGNTRKDALKALEDTLTNQTSGKNNAEQPTATAKESLLKFANKLADDAEIGDNLTQKWTTVENPGDTAASFNVNSDFTGTYFIYLEDKAGNYVLFGTDGFSIEDNAPQTCAVTNVSGYKTDETAQDTNDVENLTDKTDKERAEKIYKSASYTFQVADAESGIDHVVVTLHDASVGTNGTDTTFTFYRTKQNGWEGDGDSIAEWSTDYAAASAELLLRKADDADEMIEGAGATYEGTIRCLQTGRYTVKSVEAYDRAGNVKTVTPEKNGTVTVDNAKPNLVVAAKNFTSGQWTNKNVTFKLSSSEKTLTDLTYWYTVDGSEVAYPVSSIQNGQKYQTTEGETSVTNTRSWGTVSAGTDQYGNTYALTDKVTLKNFIIDEVAPAVEVKVTDGESNEAGGETWYRTDPTIEVSATDSHAGLYELKYEIKKVQNDAGEEVSEVVTPTDASQIYSTDQKIETERKSLTKVLSSTEFANGVYEITASATDNAGNEITSGTYTVRIDREIPLLALEKKDLKNNLSDYVEEIWTAGPVNLIPSLKNKVISGVTYYYRKADNKAYSWKDGEADLDGWTVVPTDESGNPVLKLEDNQKQAYEFAAITGSGKVTTVLENSGKIYITNSKNEAGNYTTMTLAGTQVSDSSKVYNFGTDEWSADDIKVEASFTKDELPYGGVRQYLYQTSEDGKNWGESWTSLAEESSQTEPIESASTQTNVMNGYDLTQYIRFKALSQTGVEIISDAKLLHVDKKDPTPAKVFVGETEITTDTVDTYFTADKAVVTVEPDNGSLISAKYAATKNNEEPDGAAWKNLETGNTVPLTNGINYIWIKTYDAVGNFVNNLYIIKTEVDKPELKTVSMTDKSGSILESDTWTNDIVNVSLEGKSSAGAEITGYEYRTSTDLNSWSEWKSITKNKNGYSGSMEGQKGKLTIPGNETAGTYYQFRVQTASGSYSTDDNAEQKQQLVKIDTTQPTISDNYSIQYEEPNVLQRVINFVAGKTYFGTKIKVTVTAKDTTSTVANSGIASMAYMLSSENGTKDTKYQETVITKNGNSATATIEVDPNTYKGNVTITVKAEDIAGNTSGDKQFGNLFGNPDTVNAPIIIAKSGTENYTDSKWTGENIVYTWTNDDTISSGVQKQLILILKHRRHRMRQHRDLFLENG